MPKCIEDLSEMEAFFHLKSFFAVFISACRRQVQLLPVPIGTRYPDQHRGSFKNGNFFIFIPMKEFVVYVLYSFPTCKSNTGMTSNLITRFHFHKMKSTKGFTIRYRPWTVIWVEFFNLKTDALSREKELKSGKGREWIKKEILPFYLK
ncbi:GIY-YIG nuclease family protein [Algoriphagus zhangzhouensis]|uniref:GIY-YIG nuclease family protein n=1 Tax=Algoriphagus zhangzhouensis TaxID=1073327 RepID=UPI0010CEC75D|nr:GIY-YIG nuclease family protein [Algoriphagus zhangzhouensis]TDY48803.1 putative GIY-YIG superfamily endonuclease [Algoriphagus zhangzhouensis]